MKRCLSLAIGLLLASTPTLALAGRVSFKAPPDRGLPGRREGAGTRGQNQSSCITEDRRGRVNPNGQPLSVLALIPATNEGLTLSAHPSFFFYLPESQARTANFVLTDEDGVVYDVTFAVTGEAGVIRVKLPETLGLRALKADKLYQWRFTLICSDQSSGSERIRRSGWVQRVEPSQDLAAKLAAATPTELPQRYAEAGLWYDMLAAIADLRRAQPQNADLKDTWRSALAAVELEMIADDPLIFE